MRIFRKSRWFLFAALGLLGGINSAKAEIVEFEVDTSLSQLQIALGYSGSQGYFNSQTPDSDVAGLKGHIIANVTDEGVQVLGTDLKIDTGEAMVPNSEFSSTTDGNLAKAPANYGYEANLGSTFGQTYAAFRNLRLSVASKFQTVNENSEFSTIGFSAKFIEGELDITYLGKNASYSYDLTGFGYGNTKIASLIPPEFEFLKTGLYLEGETRDTLYFPFYIKISSQKLIDQLVGPQVTLLANIVGRRVLPEADDVSWMKLKDFTFEDSYFTRYNDTSNKSGAIIFGACREQAQYSSPLSMSGPLILPIQMGEDTRNYDLDTFCGRYDSKFLVDSYYKDISFGTQNTLWLVQCVDQRGTIKSYITYNQMLNPDTLDVFWSLDDPQDTYSCKPDPIPGDYDGSGCVDASDYTVWRSAFGQSVSPAGAGADGNADGTINLSDYTVWRSNYGSGCKG